MKIIKLKDAGGGTVKVRIRPDLPEGIGESVRNPGRYIVLARPGVAFPTVERAQWLVDQLKDPEAFKARLDAAFSR